MGNKSSKEQHNFKVHIAIDFGTDGCALAFAYNGKVTVYNKWKATKRKRAVKTKTQILLNDNNEVIAFGDNAKSIYSNLSGNEKKTWKFFDKFKMSLYDDYFNTSDSTDNDEMDEKKQDNLEYVKVDITDYLTSMNGVRGPASIVFIETFRRLREIATEYLDKITKGEKIKNEDIQWIITVPSIWSEAAKDKMREWITKSGLIKSKYYDQCKIVYESDCAAVAVQQDLEMNVKCGDKYILIDAGGGTVDIACHYISIDKESKQLQCNELHSASGGKWGGCYIDNEYIKLLQRIFSKEWMEHFKTESPNIYLDIIDNFQFAKSIFYQDPSFQKHGVELPYEFVQYLVDKCKQENTDLDEKIEIFCESTTDYGDIFSNQQDSKENDVMPRHYRPSLSNGVYGSYRMIEKEQTMIYIDDELLVMNATVWKKLFDVIIDKIVKHVHDLLYPKGKHKEFKDIASVYLVGGFSASKYLQYRIQKELGRKPKSKDNIERKMIVPSDPTLCIVKGAAYFGLKKNYVIWRKLRATYGIKVRLTVKEAKQKGISEEYIKKNNMKQKDGQEFVKNCWKIIAMKGDMVRDDQAIKSQITRENGSKAWSVQMLQSDIREPQTMDDSTMVLATMKIPSAKNNVTVDLFYFYFGDTMFRVDVHVGYANDIETLKLNYKENDKH